jgi:ferric-dicitrate binding protein FerR (iron transport regulator)
MSQNLEFEPHSREARARERLRSATRPVAPAAWRERLKREFVSGDFASKAVVVPLPAARRPHRVRWVVGFAAAATVTIVAAALNQAPPWTALPSAGTGTLYVNGEPLPVRDTAGLTRRLRPGSRLKLQSTEDLDLVSSGVLAMQLSPGTEAVLPSPPGRWFGRAGRASVDRGNLRVTTGRRFGGSRLAIITPEATVHVSGTTLAVIAESTGTCVCVLEGTAHVRPHRGTMTRVTPGTRVDIARGGHRAPTTGEIRLAERPKLVDLRDRLQAVMN